MKSKRDKLKPGMIVQVSFKAGGYDKYAVFVPSYTIYGKILAATRGKLTIRNYTIHGKTGDSPNDFVVTRRKITSLRILES